MEDVLDLYAEPYDPARPVVCFDELPVQLVAERRSPLPVRPGAPARYDYEYTRAGVANLFVFCEPKRGWRHLTVTAQRCKTDFAEQMRWLVVEGFPTATVIRVVLDNLRTHTWRRSTRRSRPRRRGGSCAPSSSTTRPSTGVGSTSRRSS
jgi:hypothetical protein